MFIQCYQFFLQNIFLNSLKKIQYFIRTNFFNFKITKNSLKMWKILLLISAFFYFVLHKSYNFLNQFFFYNKTWASLELGLEISTSSSWTLLSMNWLLASANEMLVTFSTRMAVWFSWLVKDFKSSSVCFALVAIF